MSWIAAASHAYLLAALNADIIQEFADAENYLRFARLMKQLRNPAICAQIAMCAAAALTNATALAAEVVALGGNPPASPAGQSARLPAPASVEEYLIEARAAVAHYQGRLATARRLGLLRLQAVFREIVRSKRKHLQHACVIASAAIHGRRAPGAIS